MNDQPSQNSDYLYQKSLPADLLEVFAWILLKVDEYHGDDEVQNVLSHFDCMTSSLAALLRNMFCNDSWM